MGGRGASSYTSKLRNRYGSQYRTLLTAGNVKFVEKTGRGSETLMETMTQGRVYAQVDRGKVAPTGSRRRLPQKKRNSLKAC